MMFVHARANSIRLLPLLLPCHLGHKAEISVSKPCYEIFLIREIQWSVHQSVTLSLQFPTLTKVVF
jgi:hypothetical protein